MATTAGEWRSWAVLAITAGLLVAQPLACKTPDDTGEAGPDLTGALAAVGPEVVLPTLRAFREQLVQLRAAVEDWLDDGSRDEARLAWTDAMGVWQRAEVMQIGPAGSSLTAVAGADLRDGIYSWPTVNPCRIDQVTADGSFDDDGFATANLVNAYGLDGLEHLLFAGDETVCAPQVPPVSDGSWEALGPDGVAANRAAYSLVLCDLLLEHTDTLIAHWEGDFGVGFAAGTDPYASPHEALNAIFDALFYLELRTKDAKLSGEVELVASGRSTAALASNLEGFELLFDGGTGRGLDDLLVDVGRGDLTTAMHEALDEADAATAAVATPLDAITEDERVVLYEAVKTITDLLKGEVATTLTLLIPDEAAGDND